MSEEQTDDQLILKLDVKWYRFVSSRTYFFQFLQERRFLIIEIYLQILSLETTALSDLPVTCLDQRKEIYVNGSSEAISFIESKKNYNAENLEIDYEQINSLYPKTKLKFQDRHAALNKFLYTKMVIMNRYQPLCPPILNPEGIPLGGTDPAADKVLQRCTKAREKANSDLKQGSYMKLYKIIDYIFIEKVFSEMLHLNFGISTWNFQVRKLIRVLCLYCENVLETSVKMIS